MTKAERIRKLDNGARSNQQIAKIVGCLDSYVRVVLRQRVGGGCSSNDQRYLEKFAARHGCSPAALRYRKDEEFREKQKARIRAHYYRKKAERELEPA